MKDKILKFGLWASLLIVNLFMFVVLGLDSLGIAGLIMQAMMYNIDPHR